MFKANFKFNIYIVLLHITRLFIIYLIESASLQTDIAALEKNRLKLKHDVHLLNCYGDDDISLSLRDRLQLIRLHDSHSDVRNLNKFWKKNISTFKLCEIQYIIIMMVTSTTIFFNCDIQVT